MPSRGQILDFVETISLNGGEVHRRKDGIIVVSIHSNHEVSLSDAKALNRAISELSGKQKSLVLVSPEDGANTSPEVRKYGASKEANQCKQAQAILVGTFALELMANFFIRFNKPIVPTKVFLSEKTAIQWLKSFQN